MKDWFLRFSVREQLALLLMLLAIVLFGLQRVVVSPLDEARREMAQRNETAAQSLVRVDAMASELRSLQERSGAASRGEGRNLTALVNSSAELFGLQPARLQPTSRGAVQVRFESASVAALLRWLHDLETRRGLIVDELSLSQTATAGTVSATLRVAALD